MATTPVLEPTQNTDPVPTSQFGREATGVVEPPNEYDVLEGRKDLQDAAKDLCKYFIGLDKWVRRQEVVEARRQRFYWRSDQYIYWKSDSVGFITVQGGQSLSINNDEITLPRYTDVYNIYTPYGESLLSTLIQNSPGINWQPLDPSNPKDIEASKTASKYQQKIENDNDRKSLQSDVARFFYTDGRTLILVERNKEDWEEISAHGVLETKVVPITANSVSDLVSCFISDELDIYQAKEEYPDYAENIKENMSTLGESAYERIARLGVLQGTRMLMQAGDAFSHMVSRHKCFLRPSAFRKIPEALRDEFEEKFPEGLKVTFCGDAYCASENVSMDDQISIDFPGPGDGMCRPSMGKRVVPLQDVFNDELNLWHEAHDYCVPTLFMYSETGDIEAVREQISEPGNIVPFSALPPGASSAADAFYAAVVEGIPSTLPQLIEFLQGPLAQFISGAFPALFGGDTGDNDTAKGISIQRDQAMGRMGLSWGGVQRLFAGAYTNAVKSVVKHASDGDNFSYAITDRTGTTTYEELSVQDLKEGTSICKADSDASFPESTNQKRTTYMTMMTAAERNPILAATMGDPNNLEFGHDIIGLQDLVVPGAESRNKQLIEIKQLLAESPIPPSGEELQQAAASNPTLLQAIAAWQAGPKQGQDGKPILPPIPPELYGPSVKVDADFDNHLIEYTEVSDWLSGEERRKEEAKGNVQGIQNVRLHGLQHKKLIPPPPQPEPAKGGKNGPQAAAPVAQQAASKLA